MVVLERHRPDWRNLAIHESSPGARGLSSVLKMECPSYVPTQYFSDVPGGTFHGGMRCENLEHQTFSDASFDLVITQDVMEHVFHPDIAYREIARTLKSGGLHIHTTPIYLDHAKSSRRAEIKDGKIVHLFDPEYHGNPIGDGRALVTWYFGRDFPKLISGWAPFAVEIVRFNDATQGLVAEFLDVIVCRKL